MSVDGQMTERPQRPRDAATLILVRHKMHGPEVLMGQRRGDLVFMPNKFVFPGGRVSRADSRLVPATSLRADVEERLRYKTRRRNVTSLALAAIRETFEETGLLIGQPIDAARVPRTSDADWAAFYAHGFEPALDKLDFVARAVTPTGRPRRFDARFFLTEADAVAVSPPHAEDWEELLDVKWLSFDEALTLDLPWVTRAVIEHVRRRYEEPEDRSRTLFFRYRNERDVIEYF